MASSFPIVQLTAAKHLLSGDATQRGNITSLAFQSSAVGGGCNFMPSAQTYPPYLWPEQKFASNFNRGGQDVFGSSSTQLGSASAAAVTASLPINPLAMLPAGVGMVGPLVSHEPHVVAPLCDVTHATHGAASAVDKKISRTLTAARILSNPSSATIGAGPVALSQWPTNDTYSPNGIQNGMHLYQASRPGVLHSLPSSTNPGATTPPGTFSGGPVTALPSHGQALTAAGTPASLTLPLTYSPSRWYPHTTGGDGTIIASPPDERQPTETELEEFAKKFKQKRIRLGYTQQDVGTELGTLYGNVFSQTTICRFEAQQLSYRNMCKLYAILRRWVEDVETNSAHQRLADGKVPLKRRKKRTSIDASVRSRLESFFAVQPKPNAKEIADYSTLLGFDKEVIRVWFCNRRQKEKRLTPNISDTNGVLTPGSDTSVGLCSGSGDKTDQRSAQLSAADGELDNGLSSGAIDLKPTAGDDLAYLRGVTLPLANCT